jgi:hypothetical protein
MWIMSRAATPIGVLVRYRRLTRRNPDPDPEVIDRSRSVRATLNHNPVDDGVESWCFRYLDVGSASEEGVREGVGVGSGVGCG